MGMRFRLKQSYPIAGFPRQARIVLQALKEYGMLVADNGSDWYITGQHDPRWNDDALGDLKQIPGSAFEVVDTGRSAADAADPQMPMRCASSSR